MLPLRKILCPTDFSEFSHRALRRAHELATDFNAELLLLHVMQPIQPLFVAAPYPSVVSFDVEAYENATREGIEAEMKQLIETQQLQNARVRSLVKTGRAAETVIQLAQEENADLIVIATHGLSGWRLHFFGSVTERVLRLATCPVLVIPRGEDD